MPTNTPLAESLSAHFMVRTLWVPGSRLPRRAKDGRWSLCGTHANVKWRITCIRSCNRVSEDLWAQHRHNHGIPGDKPRRSFLPRCHECASGQARHGSACGAECALERIEEDPQLKAFHRRRYPHIHSRTGSRRSQDEAFAHGQDGRPQCGAPSSGGEGASKGTRRADGARWVSAGVTCGRRERPSRVAREAHRAGSSRGPSPSPSSPWPLAPQHNSAPRSHGCRTHGAARRDVKHVSEPTRVAARVSPARRTPCPRRCCPAIQRPSGCSATAEGVAGHHARRRIGADGAVSSLPAVTCVQPPTTRAASPTESTSKEPSCPSRQHHSSPSPRMVHA